MTREEAITILKEEWWYMSRYSDDDLIGRADAVNEIHKYFVEEIDKTPTEIDEDGDELYADMPTVNSLLACNKELSKRIKSLPSRLTEYKTFCGVPIEEATRIVQEHKAYPLCALADRECPFQGKEFAWCLTCPHISEEDRELVRKAVEGSEPKTGEWIKSNLLPNGWNCDNCGSPIMTDDISEMLFCPNCGCEMTPYKGGDSDG